MPNIASKNLLSRMFYVYLLLSAVFGGAIIGGVISWVVYNIQKFRITSILSQQDRQVKHLHEEFQRKEKDLNLEIMARDKKISSAHKKYELLQAEIAEVQTSLGDSRHEQDKLYFAMREEYEHLKQQLQAQQTQYENLLTERDQKLVNIQAERDNVKLKWENSAQDQAVSMLKSDLRQREQEIENLKRELNKLKEEKV